MPQQVQQQGVTVYTCESNCLLPVVGFTLIMEDISQFDFSDMLVSQRDSYFKNILYVTVYLASQRLNAYLV